MAKAPAFQFYPGDFLTGTTLMTNAEVGLFIRLLCLQAEHGCVPDDVERICRVYGEEVRGLWPVVRSKFNHGSTGSTMVNERMVKVLASRDAFRERQVAAGQASAKKRSIQVETKTQPEINPGYNHGSTVVEPIEDRDRVSLTSKKERAKVLKVTPSEELPFSSIDFTTAWDGFVSMRIGKKKPMTDRARKLIIGDLLKMGEQDAIRSLNASERAGWTDVYPPKQQNGNNGKPSGYDQKRAAFAALFTEEQGAPNGAGGNEHE